MEETDRLSEEVVGQLQAARNAGNVSGASGRHRDVRDVLSFANAAGKFEQTQVRILSFFFAAGLFAFAVLRIATLPF